MLLFAKIKIIFQVDVIFCKKYSKGYCIAKITPLFIRNATLVKTDWRNSNKYWTKTMSWTNFSSTIRNKKTSMQMCPQKAKMALKKYRDRCHCLSLCIDISGVIYASSTFYIVLKIIFCLSWGLRQAHLCCCTSFLHRNLR